MIAPAIFFKNFLAKLKNECILTIMNVYSLNSEVMVHPDPVLLDRKERHRLIRRTDIIRAAEHVFALKGFHKATIQDIARQAQYATGTVYLYFEDKDALYFSIIEEKIRGLLFNLKLKTGSENNIKNKLAAVIYESLSFFQKDQDFFRIFVQEESRWSVKSRLAKSKIAQERKEFLTNLIIRAQSDGVIRKDLPALQIMEIFESIVIAFVFNWWQESNLKDLKGLSEVILDLFLNGAGKLK